MKSKKYYNCFSPPLKNFLTNERGHVYVHFKHHYKTGKKFWVFVLDQYLEESLVLWSRRKLGQ